MFSGNIFFFFHFDLIVVYEPTLSNRLSNAPVLTDCDGRRAVDTDSGTQLKLQKTGTVGYQNWHQFKGELFPKPKNMVPVVYWEASRLFLSRGGSKPKDISFEYQLKL